MKRDLIALSEREYDLIIVGAGIFGACAAWDAASRGLKVAIIDKGDFCNATSANHFKMVHGGIRYLQHADFHRIRESSRERAALLRIAPHIVEPLPIVIPTYGRGMQGKEILGLGLMLYDLITFDRNRGLPDHDRRIPRGRIISRDECLEIFPDLQKEKLTGAAVIYDGQMYNPTRLVLSFLRSSVEAGAEAANYLQAKDFLRKKGRVCGIKVKDQLNEAEFEIRGKVVLNASGPWAEHLLRTKNDLCLKPELTYSRDTCFIIRQQFNGRYALAVQGKTRDPDAIVSRKNRHLFLVPWRDYTLVGVWHVVYKGSPDNLILSREELQTFLDEINEAYPPLRLAFENVRICNYGLVLFGDNKPGAADLSYGKRSVIVDHGRKNGIDGLITMIGVRATTARAVAEKAVNLVFEKLRRRSPSCLTATTPIFGGRFECFEDFVRHVTELYSSQIKPDIMRHLVHNYGSELCNVLNYTSKDPSLSLPINDTKVLAAEVVHAVREEMAQKLSDVVFRRTDLATGGDPGEPALQTAAGLMAREMGWNGGRVQEELEEVNLGLLPYRKANSKQEK
jgi:glycerol-3-phosphate dehydrogenase